MNKKLNAFKAALMVVVTLVVVGCGKEEKTNSNQGGGQMPPPGGASMPISGAPQTAGSIYGTWGGFPTLTSGGVQFKFTLTFQPGYVTNSVVCNINGTKIHTSVTAPAVYTGNEIHILERRENVTRQYGANCRAELLVGTIGYEMQGANSVKFFRDGEMALLSRQ